jgi:hypothetical protein
MLGFFADGIVFREERIEKGEDCLTVRKGKHRDLRREGRYPQAGDPFEDSPVFRFAQALRDPGKQSLCMVGVDGKGVRLFSFPETCRAVRMVRSPERSSWIHRKRLVAEDFDWLQAMPLSDVVDDTCGEKGRTGVDARETPRLAIEVPEDRSDRPFFWNGTFCSVCDFGPGKVFFHLLSSGLHRNHPSCLFGNV